jgi:hypothetical protein
LPSAKALSFADNPLKFIHNLQNAPLAQLDRVVGFEPIGREFESLRVRHRCCVLKMKSVPQNSNPPLSDDQLSLIERNMELSIDERIEQLQSAVELIEEMRKSLKERNENRLQNLTK